MEFSSIFFSKIVDIIFSLFKKEKRPNVRLYIEPNIIDLENTNSEFVLRFYIQNKGSLGARNIVLTAGFSGLEIIKDHRNFRRIDGHRGGTPSIQFNSGNIPLHPVKNRNSYIGELLFKLKEVKEEGRIRYDIVADDMDFFESEYPIKINLKN